MGKERNSCVASKQKMYKLEGVQNKHVIDYEMNEDGVR